MEPRNRHSADLLLQIKVLQQEIADLQKRLSKLESAQDLETNTMIEENYP
ncbi:MAG: hypothetical protein ACOX3A_03380 [bacterium]